MANVIFDFDGTLADTFPLIVDVSYRLSPRTRRLPPEEITKLRSLPLLVALRQLGIPLRYLPLLILLTRKRLKPRMHEVPPYQGVDAMLKALGKSGVRMFILTSNYRENVELFLRRHKIDDLFTDIQTIFYGTTWSKTRVLKRIMREYGLDASETYHVGNEALDMRAAKHVGIRGIATTWGGFNQKALKKTKPFAVIDKPKDLLRLFVQGTS